MKLAFLYPTFHTQIFNENLPTVDDEFGLSSDDNFWFGAGARIELEFSPQFKIWAEYSYLNNPSRPSISFENDVYGEHQAFAGIELTFGG